MQSLLSLRWRAWMTEEMLGNYMADRTFYNIHSGAVVDNPDQRLTSDINAFTGQLPLSLLFWEPCLCHTRFMQRFAHESMTFRYPGTGGVAT